MRLTCLKTALPFVALAFLIACEQGPKQTKGTPPLTEGENGAPPVAAEPIPEGDVDPERAAAMEQCWRYANSQVQADSVIDSDIYGGRDKGIGGEFGQVRAQMRPYVYEKRRKELFSQCLNQRGYALE
jgi:hypothetical protein